MKYTIERREYEKFRENYSDEHLRYGQAFYNHFNLHKMKQTPALDELYNASNAVAIQLIHQMFEMRQNNEQMASISSVAKATHVYS